MLPSPQLLSLPVRARLVTPDETARWLERVEQVKEAYTPKQGWLEEEKEEIDGAKIP